MMKHSIITSILLLLSFVFTSCGPRGANDISYAEQQPQKIVLSLVTQEPLASPSHQAYMAFAKKLEELSDDTMTIQISILINNRGLQDILEATRAGQIDIATMGYSDQSDLIPELSILGEAYVIRDYNHYMKVLDSDFGKKMTAEFAKFGLIDSDVWYAGLRQTTSNTPINSLKDFEGLKLRVPTTGNLTQYAKNLGAEAVTMNFSLLYDALKSGEVEAQENPLPTIEAARIYEVQKYIAMTDHRVGTVAIFINKEKYDSFTEEQKQWYNEAIHHGGQVCYDIVVAQEANLLEKFQKEYDMVVTYPNKDELRAAMFQHYNELEKKFGTGSISKIIEIK